MMYLTAIVLSPGGSSTVHIYTQTIHRTTQITNNVEECGPCPVFESFTLEFALQLMKKHGKTSVRVRKTSVRLRKTSVTVQCTYYQNTHTLQNSQKHTNYKTHTYTHTHTHTHITKPIHTPTHHKSLSLPHTHTHTHTHIHITKPVKTTTVQDTHQIK